MSPEEQILSLVQQNCTGNPMEYVDSIVRPYALQQLSQAIMACSVCPIHCHKTRTVFGGTGNEPIMIIGSAPVERQANKGQVQIPFEDTEEKQIIEILAAHFGMPLDKLCWMNLVNCYPAMSEQNEAVPPSRPLKSSEIKACSGYLEAAIRIVKPKFLILLGNEVLNHFHIATLNKVHGKQMEFMGIPSMVVPNVSKMVQIMHDPAFTEDDIVAKKLEFQNELGKAFAQARLVLGDN